MTCKKCQSERIVKAGMRVRKGGEVQAYQCKECGHVFIDRGIKQ